MLKKRIIVRTMLTTLRNIMYRNTRIVPKNIIICDMSTLNTFGREVAPKNIKAPEMATDPITGFKIMPPEDHSGVPHILLGDTDFISKTHVLILGLFTSSTASYEGRPPVFISSINLHGETKNQYLHIYPIPRLILKSALKHDLIAALFLPEKAVLENIISEYRKNINAY